MKHLIEYSLMAFYLIEHVIFYNNEDYNKSYMFAILAFIVLLLIEIRQVKDLLKEKK